MSALESDDIIILKLWCKLSLPVILDILPQIKPIIVHVTLYAESCLWTYGDIVKINKLSSRKIGRS